MNLAYHITICSVIFHSLTTCEQNLVPEVQADNREKINQPNRPEITIHLSSFNHTESSNTLPTSSSRIVTGDSFSESTAVIEQLQNRPSVTNVKLESQPIHDDNPVHDMQVKITHNSVPHPKHNNRGPSEEPLTPEPHGRASFASVDSEITFMDNEQSGFVSRSSNLHHKGNPMYPGSYQLPQHRGNPLQRDSQLDDESVLLHERFMEDDFVSFTIVLSATAKQCLFYSPISNFIVEYQNCCSSPLRFPSILGLLRQSQSKLCRQARCANH